MIDYHVALGIVIVLIAAQWFILGLVSGKHNAVIVFPTTLVALNTGFICFMVITSGPRDEVSIVLIVAQILLLLSPAQWLTKKVENT